MPCLRSLTNQNQGFLDLANEFTFSYMINTTIFDISFSSELLAEV